MDNFYASGNLVGKIIGKWSVLEKLPPADPQKYETGGNFSVCYIVEGDGKKAFMKVLDYEKVFNQQQIPGKTPTEIIQEQTALFNYEKNLSSYCRDRHVSKVVFFLDAGDVLVDDFVIKNVSYIVYEMANGDIRKVMNFSKKAELSAKLNTLSIKIKSLHDVSVGLRQLHSNDISHQDLKPSNVLSFDQESKIGDLGRSLSFTPDVKCPYYFGFNGDYTYAAPECFYMDFAPSQSALYQVDNYMLGGLIVFYITGVTFNLLLNKYLPDDLKFLKRKQIQSYSQVLPDITNAYQKALKDFENEVPIEDVKDGLLSLVSYLCNPDPSRRGHPKNIISTTRTPNYDLHRTVEELNKLYAKAELALLKKK